jgi:hypothetical protein
MAKTIFNLIAHVSYYTVDGVPVTHEAGYIQQSYNQHPGVVYHDKVIFYSKEFSGKGVWSTLDTIAEYRRDPRFKEEIQAAATAHGFDLGNRDIYPLWVEEQRVK